MKNRIWLAAVLALSAMTLGACGGDDEETPAGGSGGSGGSDDGGAGTTGGSGGTGGTGGSTGGTGGGAPMAMPIMCGSMTCTPPTNPLGALAGMFGGGAAALPMAYACCLENDECGYAMAANATGDACNEPAENDDRCADFMLDLGALAPGGAADAGGGGLPAVEGGFGCCTEDDQCGVDGSLFGGGCQENSAARMQLTRDIPLFGAVIAAGIPAPKACDAPLPDAGGDGDGDEDAGQ
jgi:hypothetical protein